jgi:hypothetical protein
MKVRLMRDEIEALQSARDDAVRIDRERKARITFLRRRIAELETPNKSGQ